MNGISTDEQGVPETVMNMARLIGAARLKIAEKALAQEKAIQRMQAANAAKFTTEWREFIQEVLIMIPEPLRQFVYEPDPTKDSAFVRMQNEAVLELRVPYCEPLLARFQHFNWNEPYQLKSWEVQRLLLQFDEFSEADRWTIFGSPIEIRSFGAQEWEEALVCANDMCTSQRTELEEEARRRNAAYPNGFPDKAPAATPPTLALSTAEKNLVLALRAYVEESSTLERAIPY